jgi:hypothetical protein
MYARLVQFSFGPGKHQSAQALASDLVPKINDQPGCKVVTCFGDKETGDYNLFVLWNSQEEAEKAAEVIAPQLKQHLEGNVQKPMTHGLYEVIETLP